MTRRSVRSSLLLVLLGLSATGAECGGAQNLVVKGHGTVSLIDGSTSQAVVNALKCDQAECSTTFSSTAVTINVLADAADGWVLRSIVGPDGAVGGGVTSVAVDKSENWTITVTFEENHLPECTPTAKPGAAPTMTIRTPKVCIGKYASVEGTNLGGQEACVAFADKLATEKFGNATNLSATVPTGTPTGNQVMTVWTLDGSATVNVEVLDEPAPAVPEAPQSVTAGTPFTLTGTGLDHVTAVNITSLVNGSTGSATLGSATATSLSVTIPATMTPGPVGLSVVGNCGRVELSTTVNAP